MGKSTNQRRKEFAISWVPLSNFPFVQLHKMLFVLCRGGVRNFLQILFTLFIACNMTVEPAYYCHSLAAMPKKKKKKYSAHREGTGSCFIFFPKDWSVSVFDRKFAVNRPAPPPPFWKCGVCREQEEQGGAPFSSLSGMWEQFPFQRRASEQVKTHTHTHTHNNNNIYSGSTVCPLRKFLRTRAASRGRKFPLRNTPCRWSAMRDIQHKKWKKI